MARTCLTVILAAGEGTRMRSSRPKVLHEVAGLSMVGHVVRAAQAAGGEAHAVVVGRDAAAVEAEIRKLTGEASFHEQTQRLGTAHAVLAARTAIERGHDDLLVLFGDTPLTDPAMLLDMRAELAKGAAVVVLGFRTADPTGYGRLIEADGELVAIREERDASPQERRIDFCNGGIMAIDGRRALELLDRIGNDNAKGEYYLTDIVALAREAGLRVVAREGRETSTLGVNNRAELARVEALWQQSRRHQLMLSGVTMHAPETVFLSWDTEIGEDCIIEPNVVFAPGVKIGPRVVIHAFSHLEGCRIEAGSSIGPFARLRPGTRLAAGAKVGNFCELKNADVEAGAKINHLSYVGDARVGAGANIGAGTITCNYDGVGKHHTDIGAGAFIGSNSSLVAPVAIGQGAYVASGSVITHDVPAEALGIARGRQSLKQGYATVIREKAAAAKAAKKVG